MSHQQLTVAINDLRIDLAIDRLDDHELKIAADRLASTIYRSFLDLQHEYNVAMSAVQLKMGDAMFNRLAAGGAAVSQRLVLAAYFLGVHCGRTTPAPSGGVV